MNLSTEGKKNYTMAPREVPKPTPKVQRQGVIKTNINKAKASPVSIKKTMSSKKTTENTVLKAVHNAAMETRQRTCSVPTVATPKTKDQSKAAPASVTKSAKKPSWKRRPKPAHSGVPVPEKMRKLLEKHFEGADCSF